MTSLLSRFEFKTLIILCGGLLVIFPVYSLIRHGLDPIIIALTLSAAMLLLLLNKQYRYQSAIEKSLQKVTVNMLQGKLEDRIFPINQSIKSPLNDIALKLNGTLDQMETFIREVHTVFESIYNEKFYRSTFPVGMRGVFAKILSEIDATINNMEEDHWQKQKDKLLFELDGLRNVNLLENLKKNQADLELMATEMSEVETVSSESSMVAQKSEQTVRQVLENINELIQSIDTMRGSTQALSEASREITEVTKFIAGVADKTNLLALNAAIEAARAGEAGRGFAVVADEVRNLAAETKDATDNISRIISQLVDSSDTIFNDTEKMNELSQKSHHVVNEFKQNFTRLSEMSQKSLKVVSHTRLISFATLAKVDHIVYVQKAYRILDTGRNSQEAQDVEVDDQHCRFGQWLHDDTGGAQYTHLPAYSSLQKPHHDVHVNVHQILEIIERGEWLRNKQIQARIMDYFKLIEASSDDVLELVGRLVDEKKQFESASKKQGEVDLF
ncbi:MAG: CZB domain-containing protein [gamma proteobacterium symbiont of Taylorina sp.]|nr:CZB domain-containing protein [gamma proteobacterium symbiont of Taylorina sp.]